MADICMCTDRGCPKRNTCYRYTAPACKYRQSYFMESPRVKKLGGFDCNYYWKTEENKKVINEQAVYELMFEAVLNSRYITDEEAQDWAAEKVDEVVQSGEEYLDTLIGSLLSDG